MIKDKIINETELKKYSDGNDIADKSRALIKHQIEHFELASKGYSDLKEVQIRDFEFDGFNVKVQFNPGRIKSSSAKVDKKSIKSRKCFLCVENLPESQKGLQFEKDYMILCNPFPIFPEHFTIPKHNHTLQLIKPNFDDLLELAKGLGKYYTAFYNGPNCGASAPDHMHFQAGLKDYLPIESELDEFATKNSRSIIENEKISVKAIDNYLRNLLLVESDNKIEILNIFTIIYDLFEKVSDNNKSEPMLNILAGFKDNKWRVLFFPRENHRPRQYFEEGEENILLSPASVDMGGVCITPLEKDYNKITKDDIADIFRQVSITKEKFEFLIKSLHSSLIK